MVKNVSSRKGTRYLPDPGSYALIDSKSKADAKLFVPDTTVLLFNESFNGCGVVVLNNKKLQKGEVCWIKLGYLNNPLLAKVCWRKELFNGIARVGLRFVA